MVSVGRRAGSDVTSTGPGVVAMRVRDPGVNEKSGDPETYLKERDPT